MESYIYKTQNGLEVVLDEVDMQNIATHYRISNTADYIEENEYLPGASRELIEKAAARVIDQWDEMDTQGGTLEGDAIKEVLLEKEFIGFYINKFPSKMSFYDGTLNKKVAASYVSAADKPLLYTYGYEYRDPSTHRIPVDKKKALDIIERESYLDIQFETDYVHLNAFSENDLF